MRISNLLIILMILNFEVLALEYVSKSYVNDNGQIRIFKLVLPESHENSKLIIDFQAFDNDKLSKKILPNLSKKILKKKNAAFLPLKKRVFKKKIFKKDQFSMEKELGFIKKSIEDVRVKYKIKRENIFFTGFQTLPLVPYDVGLVHTHLVKGPSYDGEIVRRKTEYKYFDREYTVFFPQSWREDPERAFDVVFDFSAILPGPEGMLNIIDAYSWANSKNKILVFPKGSDFLWDMNQELRFPLYLYGEILYSRHIYQELKKEFNVKPNPQVLGTHNYLNPLSEAHLYPHLIKSPFYQGKMKRVFLSEQGQDREYLVYIPNEHYMDNPGLFLDYHSFLPDPSRAENTKLVNQKAFEQKDIVIYPRYYESEELNEKREGKLVDKIINNLSKSYDFNREQVYVSNYKSDIAVAYPLNTTSKLSAGQVIKHQTIVDGVTRYYSVFLPDSYHENSSIEFPYMVSFHGFFFMPIGHMIYSGMNQEANKRGYVIAYPRAGIGIWNNGNEISGPIKDFDDIGFTKQVIKEMKQNYNVDNSRVFATGYSSGGIMAYRVAAEMPDYIRAFSVVGASLNVDTDPNYSKPVPLIHFHGRFDGIVPLLVDGIAGINSAKDSITEWRKVNNNYSTAKRTRGRLSSPLKFFRAKLPYERFYYPAQTEESEEVELYVIRNGFHVFPIRMHRYSNPLALDFFEKQ